MCRSETDAAVTAEIAAIANVTQQFTIPLSSVSVASSTYFPVFQYMGEMPAIRLYTTAVMYASNGCMHKQAADGHTLLNGASADAKAAMNITAHFHCCSGIQVSDTQEESFYAVGEWSEYIATFFNQEAKVKGLADLALKRCVNICIFMCVDTRKYMRQYACMQT